MKQVRRSISESARLQFVLLVAAIFVSELVVMLFVGTLRPLSELATALLDAGVLTLVIFPVFYLVVSRPLMAQIAARRVTEAELSASEKHYRDLFEANPHPMWVCDLQGQRFIAVNAAAVSHYGYSVDEFLAMSLADIRPPEDVLPLREFLAVHANDDEPRHIVSRHRKKDGTLIDVEIDSHRVFFREQWARVVLINDITERKRNLAALGESEERLRRAVTHSPFPIMIHAENGEVVMISGAWTEITGYTQAEIPTTALWAEKAYGAQLRPVKAEIDRLYSLEAKLHEGEYLIRTKSGNQRIWDFMSAPLGRLPDGRRMVVSMAMDVTERKKSDTELRASEERYRLVVENLAEGIALVNANEYFTYVNPAAEVIFGVPSGGLVGRSLFEFIAPEQIGLILGQTAKRTAGEKSVYELEIRRPSGEKRHLLVSAVTQFDPQGKFAGTFGVFRDISERRRSEAALRSSVREKEALLKEVHHRVKNNLQVVMSLLRLSAGQIEHPITQAVLKDMQSRIRSMALLHETLYRTGHFAAIDLASYLRELCGMLFRSVGTSTKAVALHVDVTPVSVNLEQAVPCGLIVNELVTNSLKHGFPEDRAGEIRVELHPIEGGPQLRLCVSDTGVGLPADFDLKRTNALGMQLVADLTRQLNGKLEIGIGPGASFAVIFTPQPTV